MPESRKRVKIKGRYMRIRQRTTSKGKRGTILGKWTPERRGKRRVYRCSVAINTRLGSLCRFKKAGKHCFQGSSRTSKCPQLQISYR